MTTNLPKWPDHGPPSPSSIALRVLLAHQNFALAGVVGLADHPFLFHALHEGSRPVVADLQAALNVAGRGLAIAQDDLHGLLVEITALRLAHAGAVEDRVAVLVLLLGRGDSFEILRRALRLEVPDDLFDLLVGAKRAVNTADASAARHVEHVALAKELLCTLLAQNGAAVDLGSDLEGDAGRKIGLDRTGDDVDRRSLRRQDDMQSGRARHLRETLHGAFDVLAGDHHQVGHLVDDHDDIRQRLEIELLVLVDGLAAFLVVTGMDGARKLLALRLRLRHARIVTVNVAHAELRHFL